MLDPLLDTGLGRVAIVELDSDVQLAQYFSSNSERIAQNLKGLQPGDGGASIFDLVDYLVELLEKLLRERPRALPLMTATPDHGSHASVEDVLFAIVQSIMTMCALA